MVECDRLVEERCQTQDKSHEQLIALFYPIDSNNIWHIICRSGSTTTLRASLQIMSRRISSDIRLHHNYHKSTQHPLLSFINNCNRQNLHQVLHPTMSLLIHHIISFGVVAKQETNSLYTRKMESKPGSKGTCSIFKTNFGGMGNKTYVCTLIGTVSWFDQGKYHIDFIQAILAFLDVFFELVPLQYPSHVSLFLL